MICPNCQAKNENRNVFCVACGTILKDTEAMVGDTKSPTLSFQHPLPMPSETPQSENPPDETPTVFGQSNSVRMSPQPPPTQIYNDTNSQETSFVGTNTPNPSINNFAPFAVPNTTPAQKTGNGKKIALVAAIVLLGLTVFGAGGYFLLTKTVNKSEVLPDHLGMFVQSVNKDKIDEIKKKDFTNALTGKDELFKDDSLTSAEANPNLLIYSDSKEISLNDLRLIQLDTIKPDGTLKQLDFQAAPVDGKPDIKRIRIPEGLANGKYAFAIIDGFLDEGKHKFWAFQVKNSEKPNNDSTLKSSTVSVKSKDKKNETVTEKTPVNTTPQKPPTTGNYVFSKSNNVVLRSAPSLTASKVDSLYSGQRLYVMGVSSNTTTWRGITGHWVNVETDSGMTGWVFAPLVR